MRNVFACLVHEREECVVDLVRNLRCLDPGSEILLYDGGGDPRLLTAGYPFARLRAHVHPDPRQMTWGTLHGFALDCMRHALQTLEFDALTIVDSDQLAVRRGYSEALAAYLAERPDVGLLGSCAERQGPETTIPPALHAHRERELWRPFLERFPHGPECFVHWTFWPSTVITAAAARDLVTLFDTDAELRAVLARSTIWATEEVILPTLVRVLGHRVERAPWGHAYVQYRRDWSLKDVDAALGASDGFWIHPIPRRYDDPLRTRIRERCAHYAPVRAPRRDILAAMDGVDGWLERDEAELLIDTVERALAGREGESSIVEVGSHCGRGTVVLGAAARALGSPVTIYAVDEHRGFVGARDTGLVPCGDTRSRLRATLARTGLHELVMPVIGRAADAEPEHPVALLVIDGLHDYPAVASDFHALEPRLAPGARVAFHDYADYFPGVQAFVDELLASGRYELERAVRSLAVVRAAACVPRPAGAGQRPRRPLVSCIMPTCDRRPFVAKAIEYFARQDYPERELVIVDDGRDPVADLVPDDARIRYLRLDGGARQPLGVKRNLACDAAAGELIVHWDDDDWMADWRLGYQVGSLRAAGGARVCGLADVWFFAPVAGRAWLYRYGGASWVYGGTLCYERALWEEQPFRDLTVGEDGAFVRSLAQKTVLALPDPGFYVGLVHAGNTSPKLTSDSRWQERPVAPLRARLGADAAFYDALSRTPGASRAGLPRAAVPTALP